MLTFNRRLVAMAALVMALPAAGATQEARTGADAGAVAGTVAGTGRYAFVPAPEGTLRLDTKTGAVSLRGGDGTALACRPVREDTRTAAAMRGVEARLAAIEERLARIEAERGTHGGDADPGAGLPTLKDEEAVDRVMDLAERMMRRFFDMVEEFRDESEAQRI